MNPLLQALSGGNPLSDGRASEVADDFLRAPQLLSRLAEGLEETDPVIHGRTAHALERISRTHPELVEGLLPRFLDLAREDEVAMVR